MVPTAWAATVPVKKASRMAVRSAARCAGAAIKAATRDEVWATCNAPCSSPGRRSSTAQSSDPRSRRHGRHLDRRVVSTGCALHRPCRRLARLPLSRLPGAADYRRSLVGRGAGQDRSPHRTRAKGSRFRHIITARSASSAGAGGRHHLCPIQAGDCMLICSDGGSNLPGGPSSPGPGPAPVSRGPSLLVRLANPANSRGGGDNITVVLIHRQRHGGSRQQPARSRSAARQRHANKAPPQAPADTPWLPRAFRCCTLMQDHR